MPKRDIALALIGTAVGLVVGLLIGLNVKAYDVKWKGRAS